jgi:hypothetical protein
MNEVTCVFSALDNREPQAATKLLLSENELRKHTTDRLASEQPDQIVRATVLVHDVEVRAVGSEPTAERSCRRHFFGVTNDAR